MEQTLITNLSTDQEDGNLYFEVNGMDISFNRYLEPYFKNHPILKKYYDKDDKQWASRIPKHKVRIKIEVFE